MDHVRRIIVHDKPPVFEPEILSGRGSRPALLAAAAALIVQAIALVQIVLGSGTGVNWFDRVSFSAVSALWLGLGILVFLQRHVGRSGRLFLLSAAAGSAFLALGDLYRTNPVDSFLFVAGLLLFPPLLLSFARSFSGERAWRRSEIVLYLPPLLLLAPGAEAIMTGRSTFLWRVALAMVAIYLLATVLQALRDLWQSHTVEHAAQSRALLFGLAAGTAPALVIFVGPLVMTGGLKVTLTWLPLLVLVFLLSMSYAVLLFEFSEADLIVRRGVVYGVLTLAIIVAYAGLGVLLTTGGTEVTSVAGGLGFVAVTVLVGAAFAPIQYAARRLVDWVLYGRRADRWQLLQALSARMAILMQPDELGDVLVREIAEVLHLRGAFLLRRSEGRFVVRHYAEAGTRAAARRDPVPIGLVIPGDVVQSAVGDNPESILIIHRKPATARHRGTLPDRYRVLDDLHAALSIPFVTRSGLEAVLCLQPKLAHDAFDADDLELLAPVIRQATAALDNALLFSRLEEKVEELRDAYRRIAREQEAERARLARELHDGTAQELAGLMTLASVAERQIPSQDGPARSTLRKLRRQAEDAYQGVRRASYALRPPMLDDFGLGPTLARYLSQFEDGTGIVVEHRIEEIGSLSDEAELALFRVAQECMENVRKHSGAREALLRLHRENGHVRLTVTDTGRGISAPGPSGIGLAGMRERIEAVGGVIQIESEPGGGVRVEASVPAVQEWKTSVPELS